MRVLLTAATGTLRPAAHHLARRGEHVLALGRSAQRLADLLTEVGDTAGAIEPLVADWTNPAGLARASATLTHLDAALIYAPNTDAATLATLMSPVHGPVIHLLTSAWAAPTADRSEVFLLQDGCWDRPPHRRTLLLGWHQPNGAGQSRWHTAAEVSAAALTLLDRDSGEEPVDDQLGVVRPWSARPA